MLQGKHFFWAIVVLLFAIVFWFTRNDPFFGDSISSISRASNLIYESNFTEVHYPENLDPGHPITYPVIHAVAWKILGRKLWVSHLIQLIFAFLSVYLVTRWAQREGHIKGGYVAGILLLLTPLFLAQSVNPNMHLPMTACALGLAYSLRFNRPVFQLLSSIGLVAIHLQGLYYLVPIWLWWFFALDKRPFGQRVLYAARILIIPGLILLAWAWYHHHITGWYLSSPDYAGHRGFPGFKRAVVNMVLADWRIMDYGQVALFFLPLLAILKSWSFLKRNSPLALFLLVFFFNAIAIAITTKTGPMHRYLLPCLPFLVLANAPFLERINLKAILVVLILMSGHLWFYPGKIMGDATLAYRSVFPILDKAKSDYDQATFYTYAPLSNPSYDSKLCCSKNDYVPLYDLNIKNVPYVLHSNISGDFKDSELTLLRTWPCYTYQRGNVYVEIFSNPDLVQNPKSNAPRTIGWFEKFILKWKHKIKGRNSV